MISVAIVELGKRLSSYVNAMVKTRVTIAILRRGEVRGFIVPAPDGAQRIDYVIKELPRSAVVFDGPAECQFWVVRPKGGAE